MKIFLKPKLIIGWLVGYFDDLHLLGDISTIMQLGSRRYSPISDTYRREKLIIKSKGTSIQYPK